MSETAARLTDMDRSFLRMAANVAKQSKCVRAQVGAVLAMHGNTISNGWNSVGADFCGEICPRGQKSHAALPTTAPYTGPGFCIAVHAEVAAVHMALALGHKLENIRGRATLYVTKDPCVDCQAFLQSCGLTWIAG